MAGIKIVTDSAADIPPALAQELGIEVVPLFINFGDQVYRANIDLTSEQFYAMLHEAPTPPTTSAPAPSVFEQIYRRLTMQYDHIFSIHHSGRLGSSYRNASQGRSKMPASLTRINVIDSKSASMGLGAVAIAAARAAQEGMPADQVAELINLMIQHTHVVFFVDTLEYLERGGRLSLATTVLGSMQRIKPIMILDEGEIVPYERTRTRAKAIEGLFTFIEDFPQVKQVTAMYSTTPEDVEKLLEKVDPIFPRDRVEILQFGPSVAAHLGPGSMGVVVFEGFEND
jgi:DegV family protein with EDD domain